MSGGASAFGFERKQVRIPRVRLSQGKKPAIEHTLGDWSQVNEGVSTNWLAQAFRIDRITCKKRLAKCVSIRAGHGGAPLYDFVEAAGHIIPPKGDIQDYMKNVKPADLPSYLQDQWWAAQLKRQEWEKRAGELWATEHVFDVLGEVFIRIKTTMQLWTDTLDRKSEMTPVQRKAVQQMVDSLQQDIYETLVEMPKQKKTGASVEALSDELSLSKAAKE